MKLSVLADLFDARGMRLLPGSFAVPVNLLVGLPDGTVAHFTARGTTVRLAIHNPADLTTLVVPTDCGCGQYHDASGAIRRTVRAGAVPLRERTLDGATEFGWTGHQAGLLRLAEAVTLFDELLETRQLVTV